MKQNLSLLAIISIVMGAQIGSGIFIAASNFAQYGYYSVAGWITAGIGAIFLALVFSFLCEKLPSNNGGPQIYATIAFGRFWGFLTGWTYWFISWVSTIAVISSASNYFCLALGIYSKINNLLISLFILWSIILLNLQGIKSSSKMELFLTILKIIPLIIIPLLALIYFNSSNIYESQEIIQQSFNDKITKVTISSLWCFIGLETATTFAGSVQDGSKKIPKAIVIGTILVLLIYLFNTTSILGAMDSSLLVNSKSPYSEVANMVFKGQYWDRIISFISSVVCIGTINAWMIASSKASEGMAASGFLPKAFGKLNKNQIPAFSLIFIASSLSLLLILTSDDDISNQINKVIDVSVISYLVVYIVSCSALFKLSDKLLHKFIAIIASIFCLWVIANTDFQTNLVASLFTIIGIPFYFHTKFKQEKPL